MLQIHQNVSLKNFNTFGIDARARYFVEIGHRDELVELLWTRNGKAWSAWYWAVEAIYY